MDDDFNAGLDLRFSREVDLPPALIWAAWTTPALLMPWFCPRPWSVVDCAIDLRPGGRFATTMRSPEGQLFPNEGCYLEVVPEQRLVWTSALGPGFRPQAHSDDPMEFPFTAIVRLTSLPHGTRYEARAMHATTADRQKHEVMGFEQGWGMALDQLVEFMRGRAAQP